MQDTWGIEVRMANEHEKGDMLMERYSDTYHDLLRIARRKHPIYGNCCCLGRQPVKLDERTSPAAGGKGALRKLLATIDWVTA